MDATIPSALDGRGAAANARGAAANARRPDDPDAARVRDAALLAAVRDGDVDAFAQLVDQHKDRLTRYLHRLTGDPAQADEIAQETFVRLHRQRNRVRAEHLGAYLLRVATNVVRSQQRKNAVRRRLHGLLRAGGDEARPGIDARSFRPPPARTPEDHALAREAQDAVRRALDHLDLTYRAPLVLREIEGLGYDEIAKVLGCRPGTVKSRIHRGRARLKAQLAPYWQAAAATTSREAP
ncbi:MAG: sigma-70 family RNA polymerase sigma factor [Acidobacteriota bacterium]